MVTLREDLFNGPLRQESRGISPDMSSIHESIKLLKMVNKLFRLLLNWLHTRL